MYILDRKGRDGKNRVLKLQKALYGTKQAARLWQETLVAKLKAMGFTQSPNDPCLFRYVGPHGECLIAAYVDDLLCAVSSKKTLEWFQSQFIKTDENPGGFYAKYLGPLHFFLGMAVDQHADYSISVNQTKYIEKMLNKFVPSHDTNAIKHSKPCVVEKFKELSTATSDLEREEMKNLPYLQVIGSLLYVMCMTRPDVAFHVTTLCKFMHDPSRDCYDAAIALLLYLGREQLWPDRLLGCELEIQSRELLVLRLRDLSFRWSGFLCVKILKGGRSIISGGRVCRRFSNVP